MSRILITRPLEDAENIARVLQSNGHEPILAPLLMIEYHPESINLDGAQALLFTSANGVRAAVQATENRTLPVFCVGDATAGEARKQGFHSVVSADGDVQALAELVAQRCRPENGRLIHVAGTNVAGNLAGTLVADGFEVDRKVLYAAQPATVLPEAAQTAVKNGALDAVLLFSPRTAKTFAKLIHEANLASACSATDMVCLSTAVVEALDGLPCRRMRVASQPTADALLDLLADAI